MWNKREKRLRKQPLFVSDYLFLFRIIKAPIIPGIHPAIVSKVTISTEPQPLSITASGGNNIEKIALKSDMFYDV